MAGRSCSRAHRLFGPGPGPGPGSAGSGAPDSEEFDESDVVWGGSPPVEPRKPAGPVRTGRKKTGPAAAAAAAAADRVAGAASLPVSIPEWSKMLRRGEVAEEREEEEWGERTGSAVIPPHELLDRTRAAPFSVHEGFGRTLKGRDLSRVRNAVWEITGFQD